VSASSDTALTLRYAPSHPRPSASAPLPSVFLMLRRPPSSPLFPYTTLFRSYHRRVEADRDRSRDLDDEPSPRLAAAPSLAGPVRSEEHTSELQSRFDLVCRLLLEKKKRREKPVSQPDTGADGGAPAKATGVA